MKTEAPILALDRGQEAIECAMMMAASEPWITLQLSYDAAFQMLADPAREVFGVRDAAGVAGFVVVEMRGLLRGYVQVLCVRSDCRRQGHGSRLLRHAEERILRDSPNVFICVSSFNEGARRLYERVGFEHVAALRELLIPGHDEILLRKTRDSWLDFRRNALR